MRRSWFKDGARGLRLAALALLSVGVWAAAGFVADFGTNDPPTGPLHWNLTTFPDPDGVSTNLVNPQTGAVRFFLAADAYSGVG
ncbi:MAG: hypothetical protein KGS61_22235, partial [Verrucomicrobia bacterium]|nr:hypothetical protein [Verrucomicrobiota bacterium]